MDSYPQLTCRCKVAKCQTCYRCKRCGCEHDGIPLAIKVSRKRGRQQGYASLTASGRKKRRTATYRQGCLAESPEKEPGDGEERRPRQQASSEEQTIGNPPQLRNPADLLRALGMERQKVESVYAHLPPLHVRSNLASWQSVEGGWIKSIFSTYKFLFLQICTIFCGMSEEVGKASWASFMKHEEQLEKEHDGKLLEGLIECYMKSTKGSVEKRVMRAFICNFTRYSQLHELTGKITNFTMTFKSFAAGNADFSILSQGLGFHKVPRTLQRFQPSSVDFALSFILSPDNISFLSWGTKNLKLDGAIQIFPAIMRKRSRVHIYAAYKLYAIAARSHEEPIRRTTFHNILSTVTAGDARLRKAVDYVTGFLVNDTFDCLRQIVGSLAIDEGRTKGIMMEMEAVRSYLKYGFDRQAKGLSDACLLHNIYFGLLTSAKLSASIDSNTICSDCKRTFYFYTSLKATLADAGAPTSTMQVVDDCCFKAMLFMGHRIRVTNQQIAIAKITEQMRENCLKNQSCDEALVVMDFKMKLEPMYFREKSVDHYGKRGMTWHGVMVQYCTYEEGDGEDSPPVAVDNKAYYDHIVDGDNKQARDSVLSMVEAMLMRLKKDLPFIKKIALQSDNATCYQNTLLPLVLPYFSAIHGVEITRFIHTETQDGKSVLDAHFARSMQVLKSWVKEGNNCVTPTQALVGLKAHGGVLNTVVELVQHDRECLHSLIEQVEPLEKDFKRFVKRADDIIISSCSSISFPILDRRDSCSSVQKYVNTCSEFTITVFDYSGIGDGIKINCKPSEGKCVVLSGEREKVGGTVSEGDEEHDHEGVEFDDFAEAIVAGELQEAEQQNECENDRSSEGEDTEDSEDDDKIETDVIDPQTPIGPITGVGITTQGQIRRRQRKWRHASRLVESMASGIASRDIVSYSVRKALQLHAADELGIRDARQNLQMVAVNNPPEDYQIPYQFKAGWAIRLPKGQMYGKKYIASFRNEIRELFEEGKRDSAKKRGPGQLLEVLHKRYSGRFDLPSENEIRQEITKLIKSSVPSRTCDQSSPRSHMYEPSQARGGRARPRVTTRPTTEHTTFLIEMLTTQPDIKPKAILHPFKERFGGAGLSDKQIKDKLSYLKALKSRTLQKT